MNRRLDVQGLRALAVLAVVAFHSGLPLPGGFVGVDVFFVISGFVITAMLRREWEAAGRIRFGAFYLRRFKRLTPALAAMVACTAVVSGLVLSPLGPQERVSETGLGAIALVANWVIAGTTGAYFDAPAATNPLLHTWSFSVEEQFYLVFPALLALSWRRRAYAVVPVVALLSFGVALVGVNPFVHSWLFGFYSPLTRGWEFAAGALVALAAARVKGTLPLSLLGIAMVVASLWLVDGQTPFPGLWTLLPVVGTSLLLFGGSNAVTRTLSARPLVRIGDWSYSIYLWHWPLIVFATLFWPSSGRARLLAAAVSFAPAVASYVWIEQPFRALRAMPRRRLALVAAVVVMSPLVVDGAMGAVASNVWTPRYASGAMPVVNHGDLGQDDFYRYLRDSSFACAARDLREHALRWAGVARCRQSKRDRPVDVAVIGDSHAEQLFVGLADELSSENVAYYVVNDAPVLSDADFARIVRHVSAATSIRAVVLNAFWGVRGVDRRGLLATLVALRRGAAPVFVTDDVPSFPFDAFECKYRKALLEPTSCTTDAHEFGLEHAEYYRELRATVRRVRGAHLLQTAQWFCGEQTCGMARNGQLLFRDQNHLNLNGSRFVAAQLLARYPRFASSVR